MNVSEIIARVVAIVRQYLSPDQYEAVLFGSQAQGTALPTSDIDIGIIGTQLVPFAFMAKILDQVEAIPTLRKIDVVDLNTFEPDIKNNILSYAKRI